MVATRERIDQLTKPRGSLGRLEDLVVQLAGITGEPDPHVERKIVMVAVGDHGVVEEGVSAYPSAVTGQMLALFTAGRAAINVLARQVHADIIVVDAGVLEPSRGPGAEFRPNNVESLRVGPGTRNLRREAAMSAAQALRAVEGGIDVAERAISAGAQVLATGDMGIGNTTSAAAVVAAVTGVAASDVVGRGTGIDDVTFARKRAVIKAALELHQLDASDGLAILAAVGGFEIGGLAGVIIAGAAHRIPIVLDGVVSGSAALLADLLAPRVRPFLIAGHRSTEPAHHLALGHLELDPLLDLQLHLGEGTGAALALPLLDAAAALAREMWTFEEAGVSEKL
jgi:nicotinate-nucleotide--dimethylbenzimidazole phosphoribosyltransferase